jgi:hypothetical protein
MDRYQFYPTYKSLAQRAWAKFRSHNYVRVLEPSAGNGDLACAMPYYEDPHESRWARSINIDCCEIDMSRHEILRAKGLTVVGLDFLAFSTGAIYSHIVMNPPFAADAKHVLKAWEILWNGELVAIIKAETLRNPDTKERQHLARLVALYGDVEYIGNAFLDPEAERTAMVEIALVYMRKEATDGKDIVGDLLTGLREDRLHSTDDFGAHESFQQVALPKSSIENMVLAFDAAVIAMKESLRADARLSYYTGLLGDTLEMRNNKESNLSEKFDSSVAYVQSRLHGAYEDLKNRAWAGLLRSTNVKDRLSSKTQKHVEAQFEHIKKLEFTLPNIYGFLCGITENQGELQVAMACEVFDKIVCYHTDNVVFYKGWKSNDKHRTCGMRVKGTRFVLPDHKTSKGATSLYGTSRDLLKDFDKVFAMLDGQITVENGLVDAFDNKFVELRDGARVSTRYFDVRYYPNVGTIHFFPRDAAMMDRLNRLVGRERAWLPPESARVSEGFWLQYDKAEQFDSEVRSQVKEAEGLSSRARDALYYLTSKDDESRNAASLTVDSALSSVLEAHGIATEYRIESAQDSLLLTA